MLRNQDSNVYLTSEIQPVSLGSDGAELLYETSTVAPCWDLLKLQRFDTSLDSGFTIEGRRLTGSEGVVMFQSPTLQLSQLASRLSCCHSTANTNNSCGYHGN